MRRWIGMARAPHEIRALVPYFVPKDDEGDHENRVGCSSGEEAKDETQLVINERLDMDETRWKLQSRRGAGAGADVEDDEQAEDGEEKWVRVEVRDWDHAEGYFKVRTHLVKDLQVPSSSASETPSSSRTSKKKNKGSAQSKSAERSKGSYAGTSFEFQSPAPSELPLPTHLCEAGGNKQRTMGYLHGGSDMSPYANVAPIPIPAPQSVTQISELEHNVRKHLAF
ncbi:hypothetical protein FVE85_9712 [Porphyridium purpureum]|uniref:Uncharacterized protein n=1 Tax=Porphyridium purpureum TaxID=35688 RepID=A0A5J4YKL7_PORPP|nr:hypothetical protein FVE85_9712 [Porphyridium purpureum]|eukprot:POR2577..scf246_12